MVIETWFFLIFATHQARVVGPFPTQASCEEIRADALNQRGVWPSATKCWKGEK